MDEEIEKSWMKEMMRKRGHPEKLHDELWFNEPGEVRLYETTRTITLFRLSSDPSYPTFPSFLPGLCFPALS